LFALCSVFVNEDLDLVRGADLSQG
jgi:hypothetical protein